eukprot:gene7892-32589_t
MNLELDTLELVACTIGSVAVKSEKMRACVGLNLLRVNDRTGRTRLVLRFVPPPADGDAPSAAEQEGGEGAGEGGEKQEN